MSAADALTQRADFQKHMREWVRNGDGRLVKKPASAPCTIPPTIPEWEP